VDAITIKTIHNNVAVKFDDVDEFVDSFCNSKPVPAFIKGLVNKMEKKD
jgi:hypothetical protein